MKKPCGNCGSTKYFSWRKSGGREQCSECGYRNLKMPEFTTAIIKSQRQEYAKDLIQPFRDGEPSREFIEAYPKKAEKIFSSETRKKAKNTWQDIKEIKKLDL